MRARLRHLLIIIHPPRSCEEDTVRGLLMSVPVNQRGQGKLEVCTKARDLAVYTLQITKNKKVFVEEYQDAITNKIISTALDIHTMV